MSLESLPNELLLQIFQFLRTSELLEAFCCLNDRFNCLLRAHFAEFGLDFQSAHKRYFDFMCQQGLPLIVDKISALCLSDDDETPYQSRTFLANGLVLGQFTSLKSLSINELSEDETLNVFVNELSNLPNLIQLKLTRCSVQNVIEPTCRVILNKIWSLPKLVLLHFDVDFQHDGYLAEIITSSSSIKHLTIGSISCPLFELSKLFKCTPNLEYISLHSEDKDHRPIMSTISSLTTLELRVSEHTTMIMNLLQKTTNLRHLKVSISDRCLNGNEWEQIINTYLPQLETLKFGMYFYPQKYHGGTIDQFLSTFKSPFWFQRQWYVRWHSISIDSSNGINFYTLPYAFSHFNYEDEHLCLSTCPDNDDNWCYEQVTNLSYIKSIQSNNVNDRQIIFPNIRHLSVFSKFSNLYFFETINCEFLSNVVPNLNKLQSIEMPRNTDRTSLQDLLDQTSELHLLVLHQRIFTLNHASIRRLDLFNTSDYLNNDECNELGHSSLITRCKVLLIKIENERCLEPILANMRYLRAFKNHCSNSSLSNDTTLENLRRYLPTAEIDRDPKFEYYIRAWIP